MSTRAAHLVVFVLRKKGRTIKATFKGHRCSFEGQLLAASSSKKAKKAGSRSQKDVRKPKLETRANTALIHSLNRQTLDLPGEEALRL